MFSRGIQFSRFCQNEKRVIRNIIKKGVKLWVNHGNQALNSRESPFVSDTILNVPDFAFRKINIISKLPQPRDDLIHGFHFQNGFPGREYHCFLYVLCCSLCRG